MSHLVVLRDYYWICTLGSLSVFRGSYGVSVISCIRGKCSTYCIIPSVSFAAKIWRPLLSSTTKFYRTLTSFFLELSLSSLILPNGLPISSLPASILSPIQLLECKSGHCLLLNISFTDSGGWLNR